MCFGGESCWLQGGSISADGNLGLVKTNTVYSPYILGAISTNPGVLLGSKDGADNSTKRPLALSGKVPIKVITENGPIAIGDPITSSSIPGVGMKAAQPGRIIGYALQSYDSSNFTEIQKIDVFISLEFYIPGSNIDQNNTDTTTDSEIQITQQNSPINAFVSATLSALKDAVLEVKTLIVDILQVRRATVRETLEVQGSIQLRDRATGEIYCSYIESGEWIKTLGACDAPERKEAVSSSQSDTGAGGGEESIQTTDDVLQTTDDSILQPTVLEETLPTEEQTIEGETTNTTAEENTGAESDVGGTPTELEGNTELIEI